MIRLKDLLNETLPAGRDWVPVAIATDGNTAQHAANELKGKVADVRVDFAPRAANLDVSLERFTAGVWVAPGTERETAIDILKKAKLGKDIKIWDK